MIESKLISAIQARMTEISSGLCEHPAEDLAKYNRQVGLYLGLKEALEFLNDLLRDNKEN